MDWLAKRGLEKVIPVAGIRPRQYTDKDGTVHDGISYPIWRTSGQMWLTPQGDPILRWKNSQKVAPKYLWMPSGLDKVPPVYLMPGAERNFWDRVAYLTSGEPDTWTLVRCDVLNSFNFFGEGHHDTDSLFLFLRHYKIEKLVAYPDRDDQGDGWAWWLKEALDTFHLSAGMKVAFDCRTLPFLPGTKGDLNQLFMDLHFDIAKFRETLLACPAYEFKHSEPVAKPEKPSADERKVAYWRAVLENECGKVASALEGSRNATLNEAAFAIGHKLATGLGDRAGAEQALLNAALSCGLKAEEARATIKSGLDKGAQADRLSVPDFSDEPPRKAASITFETADATSASGDIVGEDNYRDRDDLHFVLNMPFKNVSAFGGFARRIPSKKILGVVAPTGTAKTTALESMTDVFMIDGHDGIYFGTEWDAREMRWRAVQRAGGADYMALLDNEAYWYERSKGNADKYIREGLELAPLSSDELKRNRSLLAAIDRRPGTIYYPKLRSWKTGGIDNVLEAMQQEVDKHVTSESAIKWIAVDYVQLLRSNQGRDRAEQMDSVLGGLKAFGEANNLVMIAASQVTKSSSKEAQTEGIAIEDMQHVRPDKMNLIMILQWKYPAEPSKPVLLCHVGKNSTAALKHEPAWLWFDARRRLVRDFRESDLKVERIPLGSLEGAHV